MSEADYRPGHDKRNVHQLPSGTVKLLSSAQVITSVVSVVKELIENSLDAGSTVIDVKLEKYGFDRIEVRDNGSGISTADAPYMARPHYTSKIAGTQDLETLQTYGFRGEALGSLCAVSDVTITTKTDSDDFSRVYTLSSDGLVTSCKPSHLGKGTTVVASQLFKNLPVRKNYFKAAKKKQEELKKVEGLLIAFGVICHDVRFTLRHGRDLVWQKCALLNSKEVLLQILGNSVMACMAHCRRKNETTQVDLEAYLPKPSAVYNMTSRTTSDRSFVFVNKRPVVLKDVDKIIRKYYCGSTRCDGGRYPLMFLRITLLSGGLDVNLDPNKTTVFLHHQEEILEMLENMLKEVYGSLVSEPSAASGEDSESSRSEENIAKTSCKSQPNSLNSEQAGQCGDAERDISPQNSSLQLQNDTEISNSSAEVRSSDNIPGYRIVLEEPSGVKQNDRDSPSGVHPDKPDSAAVSVESKPSFEEYVLSTQQIPANLETQTACFDLLDDEDLLFSDAQRVSGSDSRSPVSCKTETLTSTEPISPYRSTDNADLLSNSATVYENCDSENCKDTTSKHTVTAQHSSFHSQTDDKPTEKNSSSNILPAAWSKGTALATKNGKSIEPVKLLRPGACPAVDMLTTTPQHSSNPSQSTPNICRLKAVSSSPGQATIYDMMHNMQAKRPSSGYVYFCQETRPTVEDENSEATPVEVEKIVREMWEELTPDLKETFDHLALKSIHKSKPTTAENKCSPGSSSSPAVRIQAAKKRRLIAGKSSPNLLASTVTGLGRKTTLSNQQPRKLAPFNFRKLKSGDIFETTDRHDSHNRHQLIGQLKSHDAWLSFHDNQIILILPTRVQEMLIYLRLMENHSLGIEPLETPITLQPSLVGGEEAWKSLLSMQKSSFQLPACHVYYNDVRLVKNGFNIREVSGSQSGDIRLQICGMTRHMHYFGLVDLREILDAVTVNQTVSLSDSRPIKIRHYLQGEAIRMARQLPQKHTSEDVADLLSQADKYLPPECTTCFHNRPFFLKLYDLAELPLSQEGNELLQTQNTQQLSC